MHRCTCSSRALEIFVNDLAGLTIQRSHPRFPSVQRRTFSIRAPHRQLETSQITAERFQNSFVPNGSISGDVTGQTSRTAEESGSNLRSLSELDEAWNSDAVEPPTESKDGGSRHDEFKSAEDMATQAEGMDMKKMARKVKGLEKKRQRKLEGRWAPLKKANVARRTVEGVGETEEGAEESKEVEEMSEDAIVAEVLKAPETRRGRLRRNAETTEEGTARVTREIRKRRSEEDGKASQVAKGKQRSAFTAKGVESTTKTAKAKDLSVKFGKTSKTAINFKPKDKEVWQVQKASLERKFGEQGWQPKKRLSPDTLEGIRALHNSDPGQYNTETLAKHFSITPEAIRRILKSKWRPNEEEAEDRRQRWEKRGVKKWTEMAELGVKPPSKWRQLGVKSKDHEQKKVARAERRSERRDDRRSDEGEEEAAESFAGRIL